MVNMNYWPIQPWNIPATPVNPVLPGTVKISYIPEQKSDIGQAFRPHRAGKDQTHVAYILDDSGSMSPVREATISAYNESIRNQIIDSERTGRITYVSLFKFDGYNVNCLFFRKDVRLVTPLTFNDYNPQGMTNLYDAIGGVMMDLNAKLGLIDLALRDSIIISILTDGAENSSTVFRQSDVKVMVSKAEDANWGFQFLGANINAFAVGGNLGFRAENTLQFDTKNMSATMEAATRSMNTMKGAYATGMTTAMAYNASAFTDDERTKAMGDDK